jgi:tetratricopeptide (TPR) repeat protein
MYFLPGHQLRLYRNFKAIEPNDFNAVIRFYEQNEEGIEALDLEEFLDCCFSYAMALVEAMEYGKAIVMFDHLLELTISQNIDNWGGEDLFEKLLLLKAQTQYKISKDRSAIHTLSELLKINPKHKIAPSLLRIILLRQKPVWLIRFRATAICFMFGAVLLIAFEIFGAQLFPSIYPELVFAHNSMIASGVALVLIGELRHLWLTERQINALNNH